MASEGGSVFCKRSCHLASEQRSASPSAELQACPAYHSVLHTLTTVFQHSELRPRQLEAVLAVLHGQHVLVHMATGGGKSLCMFLAPLAARADAVGVVISPLNVLRDEQV